MENEKPHKQLIWQDFLNYFTHSYEEHEMHQFERDVDKSVFDFEAVEGLEKFAPASLNYDLDSLKDKIYGRNRRHGASKTNKFPTQAIAAVAVILLVAAIAITVTFMADDVKEVPLAQTLPLQSVDAILEDSDYTQKMDSIVLPMAQAMHASQAQDDESASKKRSAKKETSTKEKVQLEKVEEIAKPMHAKPKVDTKTTPVIEEAIMSAPPQNIQMDEDVLLSKVAEKESVDYVSATVDKAVESSDRREIAVKSLGMVDNQKAAKPQQIIKTVIVPIGGNETLSKNLRTSLKQKDISYSGFVNFELLLNKKGIPQKVEITGVTNKLTQDEIEEFVLKNTKWMMEDKSTVNEGIYTYRIEL